MKKLHIIIFYSIIIISFTYCNTLNDIIDKTFRYNNWQEAKAQLEIYLQSNPTDSYAFSLYASALNELKLYDDAIKATRTAINYEKSDLNKGEYYNNLGNYYYNKGLKDIAREMYNQAMSLNNTIASPYYMLGLINYEGKDFDNSIANWKRYISLSTDSIKKAKMQEIVSKFEKKLTEEKLKAEEERKKKEEFLKKLMNELKDDKSNSQSLDTDKNKTKDSTTDIEEIN